MTAPEPTASKPDLPVDVELHDTLDRLLRMNDDLSEEVRQSLTRGLNGILDVLGIPGQPVVSLLSPQGNNSGPEAILRLSVNGHVCHYPDELLHKVYCYVRGTPLEPVEASALILDWLISRADTPAENHKLPADLIDFLELTCLEIVKMQPAVLLGQPQLEAYWTLLRNLPRMPEHEGESWLWARTKTLFDYLRKTAGTQDREAEKPLPAAQEVESALARVLNLRISLADTRTVDLKIREAWDQGRSWQDAAEDLTAALRPNIIEIQLPPQYLKVITIQATAKDRDSFTMLRDGLYYEDGLRFPEFRFVAVDRLKPNSFAVKINHLPCTPRAGLKPGEFLVDATVDRLLLLNQTGQVAINPPNLNECSIITSNTDPAGDQAVLTSWGPLSYLVLSLGADLRENYAALLDRQVVKSSMYQLDEAFPALVNATQEMFSLEDITRVLRQLLSERVSIRNLRAILEALLDTDYLVFDSSKYIVLDPRLVLPRQPESGWRQNVHYLASYVRQCLKDQISQKFSHGWHTMNVLPLEREIERLVSE